MKSPDNEHKRFDDLLDGAIDGDLGPRDRAILDAHAADCTECAGLLAVMAGTVSAWKAQPDVELDPSLRDAIGDRVMGETAAAGAAPGVARTSGSRMGIAVATAAVAAAAAVAVVLVASSGAVTDAPAITAGADPGPASAGQEAGAGPAETTREGATALAAQVTTATAGVLLVREGRKPVPVTDDSAIAPGDLITLEDDASATLEIPTVGSIVLDEGAIAVMSAGGRETAIDLRRGVISCHVERRDEGEEFRIVTPGGTVEVAGTVFRVEVLATAEASVQVAQGKVLVRDAADERNVVAVEAGRRLTFDWSNPVASVLGEEDRAALLGLFGLPSAPQAEVASGGARRPRSGDARWEALFARAQELRKAGDLSGAVEAYDVIATQAPRRQARAEAAFAVGQLLYQARDLQGAIGRLSADEALLAGTPYHEMALFYTAQAAYRLGRCDQAVAAADRFLAKAPTHRLSLRLREMKSACGNR